MSEQLSGEQLAFWNAYLRSLSHAPPPAQLSASIAGNEAIADQLLALYLSGKKTAGSSLLPDYLHSGEDVPKVGNHWIILDSQEVPRCIVKTVRVANYRFADVPDEVAIAEGEGDSSLEFWRQTHIEFFTPYLQQWGVTDLDEAELITEYYELVFRQ